MGGNPWFYFVKYEKDINHALQQLKEREFRAGRYSPVILLPEFPWMKIPRLQERVTNRSRRQ